jgi:hypothetical protein
MEHKKKNDFTPSAKKDRKVNDEEYKVAEMLLNKKTPRKSNKKSGKKQTKEDN